jgi:hypothetical protein
MTRTRTRIYWILAVGFALLLALFLSAVHKSIPYFSEIPADRFKTWRPAPYLPAGEGSSWKLSQYLEDGGALSADPVHFVLQRDGKAYDLINSRDSWGFANAISWNINLIGDRLYIYDAHEEREPGWFHIVVEKHDWLLPRLGMAPDGSIARTNVLTTASTPTDSVPGSVYKLQNERLEPVGIFNSYDSLFENLKTGDYYLASPGAGVVKVFDLEKTPGKR